MNFLWSVVILNKKPYVVRWRVFKRSDGVFLDDQDGTVKGPFQKPPPIYAESENLAITAYVKSLREHELSADGTS